jgi:uncharacterized repeat protein (TIGR03803 family)
MRSTLLSATAVATIMGVAFAAPAFAGDPEKAVYTFTGGNDGGSPQGGVIADASGALYGTTSSGGSGHSGVVYKLTPTAKGNKGFKQSTLYAFTGGADGATPMDNLYIDSTGALYGTTYAGGANGYGVVYKLTPPGAGKKAWTQTVLWTFTGGADGGNPQTTLIGDGQGNLYGTTTEGGSGVVGTVFELSPPGAGQTAWTETVRYNFTGNSDGGEPFGGLVFGPAGSIYGTTAGYGQYNDGTVYRLGPPMDGQGDRSFYLVHAFQGGSDGDTPRDGLIVDNSGNLFGTTAGFDNQGTVFELSSADGGQSWTQQVLYQFSGAGFDGNGPWQTVSMDASGALFGTTLGVGKSAYGEVFKLSPPAAGRSKWKLQVLHTFQDNAKSQFPLSGVLIGADGTLFGTTEGSAGQSGYYPGNVWKITP